MEDEGTRQKDSTRQDGRSVEDESINYRTSKTQQHPFSVNPDAILSRDWNCSVANEPPLGVTVGTPVHYIGHVGESEASLHGGCSFHRDEVRHHLATGPFPAGGGLASLSSRPHSIRLVW